MYDQLKIGEKASYDDFDASLKERAISAPKKKVIKESLPFSNITYDFSAINGEVYWEERQLEYVFEIIADSPEELEQKKAAFSSWVMNVIAQPIYDPYEPGWHYTGTFDSIDYDDEDNVEKTTITVVFLAYPYKVADEVTLYEAAVGASSETTLTITNESSHRLTPTLNAGAALTLSVGETSYGIPAGEVTDDSFMLEPGETVLTVKNQNAEACNFALRFFREVF